MIGVGSRNIERTPLNEVKVKEIINKIVKG